MILVEIKDKHGNLISRQKTSASLSIGRSSSSDVVLPDLSLPLRWISIQQGENESWNLIHNDIQVQIKRHTSLNLNDYRIEAYDLSWYEQQPLQESLSKNKISHPWSGIVVILCLGVIAYNYLYSLYTQYDNTEWDTQLLLLLGQVSALVFAPLIYSLISKALNKHSQFVTFLKIQIVYLGLSTIANWLFSSWRWHLGDFARSTAATYIAAATLVWVYLFIIAFYLFEHVQTKWKLRAFAIIALISVIFFVGRYYPGKETYYFNDPAIQPLSAITGQNDKSIDEFKLSIVQKMKKATENSQSLQLKMKKF